MQCDQLVSSVGQLHCDVLFLPASYAEETPSGMIGSHARNLSRHDALLSTATLPTEVLSFYPAADGIYRTTQVGKLAGIQRFSFSQSLSLASNHLSRR
jgi:hypothetical protein